MCYGWTTNGHIRIAEEVVIMKRMMMERLTVLGFGRGNDGYEQIAE